MREASLFPARVTSWVGTRGQATGTGTPLGNWLGPGWGSVCLPSHDADPRPCRPSVCGLPRI